MTNIEYEEPEIPAEFKLKYVINNGDEKLKSEYKTWRIMILDPADGSIQFHANNAGYDWKSERNAKKRAAWLNGNGKRLNNNDGCIAVVRKCKVTIEEL